MSVTESTVTTDSTASAVVNVKMRTDRFPIGTVVTHPGNPRKDLGDLRELEDSIREIGVLQPPVVMPADRVAAAWAGLLEEEDLAVLAAADWVVLMGARRRTAAGNVLADPAADFDVLVREDAICDDPLAQLDVMTAENVARSPLSPVEEARSFAQQEAAGRKQHEIATRMGCSQSHVSKRLQLLKLPASMLTELETGWNPDEDQDDAAAKKPLQIKDALAYVKAAGGDQFVILAAHKLRQQHRQHMSPAELVDEVRREQQRRRAVAAATTKLAAEGTKVIDSGRDQFGNGYRDRELRGHKAIAQARKAGTVVAEINHHGQVAYYSTAGAKPKKADNRSDAEQERITDERERRKAMTARADAAAAIAAQPPKLPEVAADIVDAWLWAPGNDVAQLAQKWLVAAPAGPDPQLAGHEWWQQIRTGAWPIRVHAAHALALARHEVNTRATYRTWSAADAVWLARLVDKVGYTPTPWEQARLDAIGHTPAAPAPPEGASLAYDHDDNHCWVLYFDLEVDEPAAWADDLGDPDTVDEAKVWAQQLLHDEHGIDVVGWRAGQLLAGYPAWLADFAGPAEPGGYVLGWSVVDGWCVYAVGDPAPMDTAGPDIGRGDVDVAQRWAGEALEALGHQVTGWQAGSDPNGQDGHVAVLATVANAAGPDGDQGVDVEQLVEEDTAAVPVEYRLHHDETAGEWQVHAGDVLLADHDCLTPDAVDAAVAWASSVLSDEGITTAGWDARVGSDGPLEYVAAPAGTGDRRG